MHVSCKHLPPTFFDDNLIPAGKSSGQLLEALTICAGNRNHKEAQDLHRPDGWLHKDPVPPTHTHTHTPIHHLPLDMHSPCLEHSYSCNIQQTSHRISRTRPTTMSRYLALSHLHPPCSSRAPKRRSPHLPTIIATLCVRLPPYLGSSIDALRAAASCMFLCCLWLMSISLSSLGALGLVADDMWVCYTEIVHVYQAECPIHLVSISQFWGAWLTWKKSCRWGTYEHVVLDAV